MASYSISDERIAAPGKTDLEIAESLARNNNYLVIVRYKSSESLTDSDKFGCCKHDYEVKGYFSSPYCFGTEIFFDSREPRSSKGKQRDTELSICDELQDSNPESRINAVKMIGQKALKGTIESWYVEKLVAALKDDNMQVRKEAAWALGYSKDERAVLPLIDALRDEFWAVRSNAAESLGNIGDLRAVDSLVAACKDERLVREQALTALWKLKDSRAIEPCIDALKDSFLQTIARIALEDITRLNFGLNLTKWEEWWKRNKQSGPATR